MEQTFVPSFLIAINKRKKFKSSDGRWLLVVEDCLVSIVAVCDDVVIVVDVCGDANVVVVVDTVAGGRTDVMHVVGVAVVTVVAIVCSDVKIVDFAYVAIFCVAILPVEKKSGK